MSDSSVTPKVECSPVQGAAAQPIIDKGVLRLDLPPEEHENNIAVDIIPFAGSCPDEGSLFFDRADKYRDTRSLSRFTLRFQEKEGDDMFADFRVQDAVKVSIWDLLAKVMSDCTLPRDLPRIIIHDFKKATDKSSGTSVFDLVFPCEKAFLCVDALNEIDIGDWNGQRRVFTRVLYTCALPSDIFIIDCLDVKPEEIDSEKLFSALAAMTASIGSLVGLAKIYAGKEGWKQRLFPAYSGTLRAYVKLDVVSFAAPLKDLAAKLPTVFVWLGASHQLLYTGHHLHPKPVYSPDYGLSTAAQPGTTASTAASTTAGSAQKEGTQAGSSNASKKRKKRSE